MPAIRSKAKLILRLAVSAALFAVILSRVEIAGTGRVIAGASIPLLALALFVSLLLIAADALLWKTALRSLGYRIDLGPALTYSVAGSFFGNFAPSALGVDLFRAAQLRRLGVPIEIAVRAVVSTRLVSFASLLVIIVSGLPILLGFHLPLADQAVLLAIVTAGIVALTVILLMNAICRRWPAIRSLPLIGTIAAISRDLARALKTSQHAPASWFYSALAPFVRIGTFALVAAALNVHVNLGAFYALIPVALLVAMVPISLGSWGVREASVIYFLGWAGIGAETALSISVLFGISRLFVGACGGIVWLLARSHHYGLEIAEASDLK